MYKVNIEARIKRYPFRAERPKMVIHNLKILQKMLEAF